MSSTRPWDETMVGVELPTMQIDLDMSELTSH